MSALGLDHLVVLVPTLEAGRAMFEDMGFTVTPGGTHAGGFTSNELVGLLDGVYLELIAFNVPPESIDLVEADNPLVDRFVPRVRPDGGLIDVGVVVDDLDRVLALEGFPMRGPLEGNRVRPDGKKVAWRMAFPEHPGVPFVIQDLTARDLRVPGGEAARHKNGAIGVLTLGLGDPHPDRVLDWLEAIGGGTRDGWTLGVGGCRVTVESAASTRVISATIGCGEKEPIILI